MRACSLSSLKSILTAGVALLAVAGFAEAQTPQITGIKNAAPLVTSTGNVARGELISIYGSNLTNGVTLESFPPTAPTSVGGTSVKIGSLAAPILYVSPTQINVQVPFEIPAGVPSVNITVTVGTLTSAPFLMSVVTSDLGMFSAQGGLYLPVSANTALVNATPGTTLTIAATGLGSISPAVASGTVPVSDSSNALATPSVTINGASAQVLSATYVGLGVYAITATVPQSADTGSITVVLGGAVGAITGGLFEAQFEPHHEVDPGVGILFERMQHGGGAGAVDGVLFEDLVDLFLFVVCALDDLALFPNLFRRIVFRVTLSGEITAEAHGDRTSSYLRETGENDDVRGRDSSGESGG